MHVSVYLALTTALALSVALRPVAGWLAPKPAAITLAIGSLVAGCVWLLGLALLGFATLARLRAMGELGRYSVKSLDAHNPVPVVAGLVSLLALVLTSGAIASAARRLVRGLIAVRHLHTATATRSCGDLAIIDAEAPEAMALPGWRGRIVVTSGMLRALEPAERQVMLAHERSHLRNAHWAFRLAARLGAALLPLSRPLIESCDQSLERWADEQAADHVGDRQVAATAVARAALAVTDHHRSPLVAAFSGGAVSERVQALLAPRRHNRWGWPILLAGLTIAAVAFVLHAGHDLDAALDMARFLGRS